MAEGSAKLAAFCSVCSSRTQCGTDWRLLIKTAPNCKLAKQSSYWLNIRQSPKAWLTHPPLGAARKVQMSQARRGETYSWKVLEAPKWQKWLGKLNVCSNSPLLAAGCPGQSIRALRFRPFFILTFCVAPPNCLLRHFSSRYRINLSSKLPKRFVRPIFSFTELLSVSIFQLLP